MNAPHAIGGLFAVAHYPAYAAFLRDRMIDAYPNAVLIILLLALVADVLAARRIIVWLLVPLVLVTPFAASFDAESDVTRYYLLPLLLVWSAAAIGSSGNRLRCIPRCIASAIASAVLAFIAYTNVNALPRIYDQHEDRLASTFIRSVLDSTDADAAIVVPWVYATPLAYAAYVDRSVARRLIVVASPSDDRRALERYRRWNRPVYVIDEKPQPMRDFAFVRAFAINANPATDPKLYRLRALARTTGSRAPRRKEPP